MSVQLSLLKENTDLLNGKEKKNTKNDQDLECKKQKLPNFGPSLVCSHRLLHNLPQAHGTQTPSEKDKWDLE